MDEWQVVLVLISLAGFIGVFVNAAAKMTQSITELTVEIRELFRWRDESNDLHKELKGDIQKNADRIADHENRLQIIEKS